MTAYIVGHYYTRAQRSTGCRDYETSTVTKQITLKTCERSSESGAGCSLAAVHRRSTAEHGLDDRLPVR